MKVCRNHAPAIRDEVLAHALAHSVQDDERDAALVELWRRYEERPFPFARRGCPETVWAVLARWRQRAFDYDAGRPFLPFFKFCVWQEWLKSRKRRRSGVPIAEDEDGQPVDPRDPTEELERADALESLRREVEGLPPRERVALSLLLEGRSVQEGAVTLGLSIRGFALRAASGRLRLARTLPQKLGIEPARAPEFAGAGSLISYFVHDKTVA